MLRPGLSILACCAASALQIDTVSYGTVAPDSWGRDILIAGPASLRETSPLYPFGQQLKNAASLFSKWVNVEHGGVNVGGTRHAVRFTFIDDGNSVEQTLNATRYAIDSLNADFIFGGYSTRLTMGVSLLCLERNKILQSAGSGVPAVFRASNLTFGMAGSMPSNVADFFSMLEDAADTIDATQTLVGQRGANATELSGSRIGIALDTVLPPSACDGRTTTMGSCRAALKLGFLQEDSPGWPGAFCAVASGEVMARGLGYATAEDGAALVTPVPPSATEAEIDSALRRQRDAQVTVLYLCGYYEMFEAIVGGLERLDWTPLAFMVGNPVVSSTVYKGRVQSGWWQGEYITGATDWHWKLPGVGTMSGMTAQQFYQLFYDNFGEYPTEQASGQFGQALLLVAAIEAAQSLETGAVARELRRARVVDIYGNSSYRPEEGMHSSAGIRLQFRPRASDQDIVHPISLSSALYHFPTPSWRTRKCRVTPDDCSTNGYCGVSGECVCHQADGGRWTGAACSEWEPDPEDNSGVIIAGSVSALVTLVICLAVGGHVRRRAQKARDTKRMHQAFANVEQSRFPTSFMRFRDLKQIGKFAAHERLRDTGKLMTFDSHADLMETTARAPSVFCSHQWLGFDEPDPSNVHYQATIEACSALCDKEGIADSDLLIWIDYQSIPQRNAVLQQLAIDSLAVYASCCRFFIIVAPEATHADTKAECNPTTYLKRGWCRLEQWARFTMGRDGMYLFGANRQLQVLDDEAMDKWTRDAVLVFEGDFTKPSDKDRLFDTVLGIWAKAVIEKQRDGGNGFLYQLVQEEKSRVFPRKYFARAQHDLVERKILKHEHVGAELKRQAHSQAARTSGSIRASALAPFRHPSATMLTTDAPPAQPDTVELEA